MLYGAVLHQAFFCVAAVVGAQHEQVQRRSEAVGREDHGRIVALACAAHPASCPRARSSSRRYGLLSTCRAPSLQRYRRSGLRQAERCRPPRPVSATAVWSLRMRASPWCCGRWDRSDDAAASTRGLTRCSSTGRSVPDNERAGCVLNRLVGRGRNRNEVAGHALQAVDGGKVALAMGRSRGAGDAPAGGHEPFDARRALGLELDGRFGRRHDGRCRRGTPYGWCLFGNSCTARPLVPTLTRDSWQSCWTATATRTKSPILFMGRSRSEREPKSAPEGGASWLCMAGQHAHKEVPEGA